MTTHHHPIATRTSLFFAFLIAALLGPLPTHAVAGETIDDPALGFKLTLPEGFWPIEQMEQVMPTAHYGFAYGDTQPGKISVVLFIVKLGKPLSHTRMERSDLDPGFRGMLHRTTWQGLEVPLVEIPEEAQGLKGVTLSVLIPLERQAINVKLVGPAERKAELRALLDQVVAGLSGRSNWSSSPTALSRPVGRQAGIAIMIATFLVAMLAIWLISKYCPRGTVLLLAILLYGWSRMTNVEATGVGVFIRAPLTFVGFVGIILGIIDLRRKPRAKAVPSACPVLDGTSVPPSASGGLPLTNNAEPATPSSQETTDIGDNR